MGASPETSVINPYLQHWQMPNLWVEGGSALPQGDDHSTMTVGPRSPIGPRMLSLSGM